uniref:Serine protease n=1 Tax=Peronospora matthiolae TaxID=2874970 RepID=A0AAV1UDY8_9STRA
MKLFRPLFILLVALQVVAGTKYTDKGIAIVGATEPWSLVVEAGDSCDDYISYNMASYIAVHFADFDLPDGDSVVISSPDADTDVSHTYTGRGRDQSGTFVASFIPGGSVTITYNSVGEATSGQGYRVTGFSRGFPTVPHESVCGDGDQSSPAKCYAPGSSLAGGLPQAYEKSQAVARLLINGTYLCTGWLAGSEGHLFTNQHCFENEEWALNTDIEFAAESSSCREECKKGLGCAGKVVATTATYIHGSKEIDYSVLKLPDCVSLTPYGYLQLRESGPVLNETIYVPQHPSGFAKRIASKVDGGGDATIHSVGEETICGAAQVGHYADTREGSSGSPILSSNDNLVVAVHHCGGCANAAVDVRTVLDDLKVNSITIKDLVPSGSSGQGNQPLYAQTPCSATPLGRTSNQGPSNTAPTTTPRVPSRAVSTVASTKSSNTSSTSTNTSESTSDQLTKTVTDHPTTTNGLAAPISTTTSRNNSNASTTSTTSTTAQSASTMTSTTALESERAMMTDHE